MNKDIFSGVYIGIVVQNNDPEMRGRVKVYVPYISTLSTKLNKTPEQLFTFPEEKYNKEFIESLEEIKGQLPWAEYAGPIFGGSASGRYNANLGKGTTSDSNAWKNGEPIEGFRPAQNFVGIQRVSDAFSKEGKYDNRKTNQFSMEYTPSNYSNLARGTFSIPNVGAHVYLFFWKGDPNFPVYFASVYGKDDIKRIYTRDPSGKTNVSPDYPNSYENRTDPNSESDGKTFRSGHIINSNKHTVELIDTDLREILKLTHYSGSFKEFNNYSNIEFASNNDQKMVMGDYFSTIWKNKSSFVGGDSESIVQGDNFITIGKKNFEVAKNILLIHKKIHNYKLLFDIQRAKYGDPSFYDNKDLGRYGTTNDLSTLQKMSGDTKIISDDLSFKDGFKQCPVCGNRPYDPYDPKYTEENELYTTEKMWLEAPMFLGICVTPEQSSATPGVDVAPENAGFSIPCQTFLPVPPVSGEPVEPNPECPAQIPHPFELRLGYYKGMKCACCGGTGFSPSTQDGSFVIEPLKEKGGELENLIISSTKELLELERQLTGGDYIQTIALNKVETIGLAINDMKSFRVDPIGKLRIDGCHVAPQGTYSNFKPSPHVEYVDVADTPGGDYNLNISNKWKVLVGARGINIKTYGPIDMYGTIVNITAEQMNISSKNEVLLDGGERISFRARKISFLPVEHSPVVIEGQLHVTRNVLVQGGCMLEGEVAVNHVTAPLEWQKTETAVWETEPTCAIPARYLAAQQILIIPKHSHPFKNLPLTLLPHPEAVRETMIKKGINSRKRVAYASTARNPIECSDSLWQLVEADFTQKAWEKTLEQASSQGVNINSNEWRQWGDADGTYLRAGGPMSYRSRSCTPLGDTTASEQANIQIVANYNWDYSNKKGAITITGTVDSEGNIIGELS